MKRRVLSLSLVLLMLLGMAPAGAQGAEPATPPAETTAEPTVEPTVEPTPEPEAEKSGAVLAVEAAIAALPAAEAFAALEGEAREAALAELSAASDLFAALGEDEQAQVEGLEKLYALFAALDGGVSTAAISNNQCDGTHGDGWTAWSNVGNMPTEAGSYYLTADVKLTATWSVPVGTVNLCLNGHSITQGAVSSSVINIPDGATLNLYDCKTTTTVGHIDSDTGLWTAGEGEAADTACDLAGGVITGGDAGYGGGLVVQSGGVFNMYGGNIAGNSASNAGGGGVYVYGGTFTMYGGSITGNSANVSSLGGGGVCVAGAFTMHGGSITGNSAINVYNGGGGGVYVGYTFTMTGGSITGNTTASQYGGGGVCVHGGGTFSLSGSPVITGNKNGDEADNVHLSVNKTITVTGLLGAGASIGVRMEESGTLTSGWGTSGNTDYSRFFNDNGTEAVVYTADKQELQLVDTSTAHACDGILFDKALTAGGTIGESGNYYLAGDVTLDETLTIGGTGTVVNLCLNGHKLTGAGSGSVIKIETGAALNLYDCDGSNGSHEITSKATNSSITVTGGVITGGTGTKSNSTTYGGGVYVSGTFNMYAGNIAGNTATEGGGISVSGTFNMYGGNIAGNSANGGGGAYIVNSSEFTMSGGTIAGNSATGSHDGGGVYMSGSDTTVTMSGGSITGNSANNGGGVYVGNGGTFNMTGGSITGNSANGGGGVYAGGGTFNMTAGSITGNSATVNGGGVYVYGGTFKIGSNAVTVSDNKGYGGNNNVYLTTGRTIACEGASGTGEGTRIGVTMYTPGVFTSGTTANAEHFFSDNESYSILDDGSALRLGKVHDHANGPTFDTALTSATTSITTSGSYYLAEDVTLDSTLEISGAGVVVDLCLNGNVLSLASSAEGSVITVGSGATLNLYDCEETTHKFLVDATSGLWTLDEGSGTQTLTGGVITGGTGTTSSGTKYGGGVYVSGTLNMYGGNIAGNSAGYGGGMYVSGGWVTMYSGNIAGNSATRGGGVYVYSVGTFTLHSGEIAGNSVTYYGGGVFTSGAFTMTAGSVTGNTASYEGGGVYVNAGGSSFTVSGSPVVTGNTEKGEVSNVSLGGADYYHPEENPAKTITIGGALTAAALGVRVNNDQPRTVTSGWSTYMPSATPGSYFTSDDGDYIVMAEGNELKLAVKVAAPEISTGPQDLSLTYGGITEEHKLTITATTSDSGALSYQWYCNTSDSNTGGEQVGTGESYTIPTDTAVGTYYYYCVVTNTLNNATATATSEVATVTVGAKGVAADELTVELAIPDGGYTYDKTEKQPGVTVKLGGTVIDVGEYSVSYSGNVNAGTNTAAVTITDKAGGNYALAEKSASFSIAPREITVTADAKNKMYGQSDPELTYEITTGSLCDGDSLSGKLSREAGEDVGGHAITQGDLANGNYAITFAGATLTISPATLTAVSVTQSGALTYNGSAQTAAVSASATAVHGQDVRFTYSATQDGDYKAAVPSFTDAGTYTVYYKAAAPNHEDKTGSFTVTIGKKELANSMIGAIAEQIFTGSALEPKPAVSWTPAGGNALTLAETTDFTYEYSNNTAVGSGAKLTITATANGNYTGSAEKSFNIVYNTALPEDVSLDSILSIDKTKNAEGWYKESFTITGKDGWTVSETDSFSATGVTVTGDTASGSKTIYVKNGSGNIYQQTFTYKLDTTSPTVTGVTGNPTAWTKEDVTLTVNGATDATSGLAAQPYSFDGGTTWQTEASKTFTENTANIVVKVKDAAGNVYAHEAIAITKIDKTAPTAAFGELPSAAGENGWHTANVTVPVSVSDDNLKEWRYSTDGGNGWEKGEGTSFQITENGDHTVKIKAIDQAGNETVSDAASVKLDKDAPAAPTVATGGYTSGAWTSGNVTFTLSGTPTTSGHGKYQYSTDGNTWYNVTGSSLTHDENTASGGVTYYFRAVNDAGTAGAASAAVTVKRSVLADGELTATQYGEDDLAFDKTANSAGWYKATPTVTVEKKETVGTNDHALAARTYYKLWKDQIEPSEATTLAGDTITPSGDGEWKLKIWTEDEAGNATAAYTTAIRVDTTAPTVEGVTVPAAGWHNQDETISFTAGDATSGVESVVVKRGDTSYTVTGNSSFTADVNGTYTITVTDKAGNGTTETVEVTKIDKTAPVISFGTLPSATGENGWHKLDVTVPVVVSDANLKEWRYSTDGGESWSVGTGSSFTISANGDYTGKVKIKAVDEAGNETVSAAASVKLDKNAPTIEGVSGNPEAWTKEDVTLTVTGAADATSGLAEAAYSFDGGETWQAGNTKTYTANTSGIVVKVRDAAGNVYTHGAIAITKIDKTAPALTLTSEQASGEDPVWYGAATLDATATDGASGMSGGSAKIEIAVNGQAYTQASDITAGKRISLTATGTYIVTVTATDAVGNTCAAQSVTVRVEAGIKDFTDAMDGLRDNSDFADLSAAKAVYDGLTHTQKTRLATNGAAVELLDNLNAWLAGKQEAALADFRAALEAADSLADIDTLENMYQAMPADWTQELTAAEKRAYEALLADRAKAQAVITLARAYNADSGYTVLHTAVNAGDALTEFQKGLLDESTVQTLARLAAVRDAAKLVETMGTPTAEKIGAAGDAYDANATLYPANTKTKLDALRADLAAAQGVKNTIEALTDNSDAADVKDAKAAYDALTDAQRTLVPAEARSRLDRLYNAMLADLESDERAALAVERQIAALAADAGRTVADIDRAQAAFDALTAAQKAAVTNSDTLADLKADADAARTLVVDVSAMNLNALDSDDEADVKALVARYEALEDDQEALVQSSTGGKMQTLAGALDGLEAAKTAIAAIPEDTEADDFQSKVEAAKDKYEKLSDTGRRLVGADEKTKLDGAYAALLAKLDYRDTDTDGGVTVTVVGLTDKLDLADVAPAGGQTTTVAVVIKQEAPPVLPEAEGKEAALSVDAKLIATVVDEGSGDVLAEQEVQPETGKQVTIKLSLPGGYDLDTLELWHVKAGGGMARIAGFRIVTENGAAYAVFEVDSFSHFVLLAERLPSGGGYRADVADAAHGSVSLSPDPAAAGSRVTVTVTPEAGYALASLTVRDAAGNELALTENADGSYSFTQPACAVRVSAEFRPAGLPFTDVGEDDWFYGDVTYVYENGLMQGTGEETFSPRLETTRGMIVTILWRLEGEPAAAGACPFADVPAGRYYAAAVAWAAGHGVVEGYSETAFGPEDAITREQLAAILWRYARHKGYDTSARGDLGGFADAGAVSGYAVDAMAWAVAEGVVQGTGEAALAPRAAATRAQAAAVLHRFCEAAGR